MALFQPEGWALNTQVKSGSSASKNNKRNRKRKQQDAENNDYASKIDEAINGGAKEGTKEESQDESKGDAADLEPRKKSKKDKKPSIKTKEEEPVIEEALAEKPTLEITPQRKLTPLQQKMMSKLTGSRFRWINEQLYTITSDAALQLVKEQPSLFDEYHEGFRSQVQAWPENPVDVFVNQIKERSTRVVNAPGGLPGLGRDKKVVIADMGCGEAQFSADIIEFLKERNGGDKSKAKGKKGGKFKGPKLDIDVHSFDLKKANERITVADIRHVPLPDNSCTVVIFCLALMGTNFLDFIKEAYRILAPRGELWIAEIKSRFTDRDGEGEEFVKALKLQGFFHKSTDSSNKMFTRFEFFKASEDIIAERKAKLERRQKFIEYEDDKEQLDKKRQKIPEGKWLLKPCIYKRR
jgi:ribosomal RNA-processing protein 8